MLTSKLNREAPAATTSREPDADDIDAQSEQHKSPAAMRRGADNAADNAEPARKRHKFPTTSLSEGDTLETNSHVDESTSDSPNAACPDV